MSQRTGTQPTGTTKPYRRPLGVNRIWDNFVLPYGMLAPTLIGLRDVGDIEHNYQKATAMASCVVMGVRHRTLSVEGVQFHPESILTPEGPAIVGNFLALVAN